ncbi:hypothetical protein OIU78_027877 [Salix suchowensis]|nr:hypothetical protein OIU78_027877 [Salix suchowensis]
MGRLADVVRVRRMMKVQGVRKETGCSWIELKSHVHVFVVGDQIHQQIGEIQGAIWRLRKHMKDEGYRPGHDSASMFLSWQSWNAMCVATVARYAVFVK